VIFENSSGELQNNTDKTGAFYSPTLYQKKVDNNFLLSVNIQVENYKAKQKSQSMFSNFLRRFMGYSSKTLSQAYIYCFLCCYAFPLFMYCPTRKLSLFL